MESKQSPRSLIRFLAIAISHKQQCAHELMLKPIQVELRRKVKMKFATMGHYG